MIQGHYKGTQLFPLIYGDIHVRLLFPRVSWIYGASDSWPGFAQRTEGRLEVRGPLLEE